MKERSIEERLAAAQAYLDGQVETRPVEAARGRLLLGLGGAEGVLAALARYQNDDGGFGNGLEPDITAPQSNPFAAQMALNGVLEDGIPTTEPFVTRLVGWLEDRHGDDGCWRWEPGTLDHPIAPWFAGWEFPNLNPAMGLSAVLTRLGLGSQRLHRRCRDLYVRLANPEEMTTGAFYEVLPYADSLPWLPDLPGREAALESLADSIARRYLAGDYDDPQHAASHLGPADGPIARRIPPPVLATVHQRMRAALLDTQQDDGSWPSPYAGHWGPAQTVQAMTILKRLPT